MKMGTTSSVINKPSDDKRDSTTFTSSVASFR